jgi:hypothetical protein
MATNDPKGFLTTFTLLGREYFTLAEMSWILIKVFFGSSYLGFVSHKHLKLQNDANQRAGHHGQSMVLLDGIDCIGFCLLTLLDQS